MINHIINHIMHPCTTLHRNRNNLTATRDLLSSLLDLGMLGPMACLSCSNVFKHPHEIVFLASLYVTAEHSLIDSAVYNCTVSKGSHTSIALSKAAWWSRALAKAIFSCSTLLRWRTLSTQLFPVHLPNSQAHLQSTCFVYHCASFKSPINPIVSCTTT